jgi:predicted DCC family thiol-disulfide oxidoreductase YuxK
VFYDDECQFCKWLTALLLRWDRGRRLRAASIQSGEGERSLGDLSPEQRLASWHFVDQDGRRLSAGDAFPPLLRRLPGGRGPAWLAARFPRLVNRAYFWVARNRHGLSRLVPGRWKRRAAARL